MAFWKVLKDILYAATIIGPWLRYKQRKRAKAEVVRQYVSSLDKKLGNSVSQK